MKKPELLAPAGNLESLVAAIEAGCDAVYLAGNLYGARNYAGNFNNEQLIYAINYCHLYGVKVYVTVNTLIYEDEINNFIKYIEFLHQNNVDAIIIQDIGMFDLVRKLYPNLEIHISTQMHIHNLEGCQLVEQMGATRVVLARETPIELIKEIKEKCNIELEVFVHGALCISYSGQCLMSSLIGGRSGNRGTCAQCCRQPYDLYCNDVKINKDKYLLSTRDLNTLDNIGYVIENNIDSLKIEGRMKRPEYVFLVVSLYRKAIDNYLKYKKTNITEQDIKELKKIFNRKFTKGFLFNTKNEEYINNFRPNHLGIEIGKIISTMGKKVKIKLKDDLNIGDGIRFLGMEDAGMIVQVMYLSNERIMHAKANDVITIYTNSYPKENSIVLKTTDIAQLNRIKERVNMKLRKVSLKGKLLASIDKKIVLNIIDEYGNKAEVINDYIVTSSITSSTTRESIIKQLNKLGDTNYILKDLEVLMDSDIFIPMKVLNDLRRSVINILQDKVTKKCDITKGKYSIELPDFVKEKKKSILINSEEQYNYGLNEIYDQIIIPVSDNINNSMNVMTKIPRVQEKLKEFSGNLLVGELGSIKKYCNGINHVTSDFSLNVTNSYSVALLHSLGVEKITLSLELNDYQIKKIIDNYHMRYGKHPNLELIVSGPLEAMILKYDLLNGKYDYHNKYYLRDKYGNKFPVFRNNNLTYIYYHSLLNKEKIDNYYDLGINCLRENSINL